MGQNAGARGCDTPGEAARALGQRVCAQVAGAQVGASEHVPERERERARARSSGARTRQQDVGAHARMLLCVRTPNTTEPETQTLNPKH